MERAMIARRLAAWGGAQGRRRYWRSSMEGLLWVNRLRGANAPSACGARARGPYPAYELWAQAPNCCMRSRPFGPLAARPGFLVAEVHCRGSEPSLPLTSASGWPSRALPGPPTYSPSGAAGAGTSIHLGKECCPCCSIRLRRVRPSRALRASPPLGRESPDLIMVMIHDHYWP